MTIPAHAMSTIPEIDPLIPPDDKERSNLVDYESGGFALYDTSQASTFQTWTLTYTGGIVWAKPDNNVAVELFTMAGITEATLTFDLSMNPFVAYMIGNDSWIWWFDTEAGTQVHTQLPAGAVNPRCTLDDKREQQSLTSDVILAYMMGSSLYTREQRERFGVDANIMVTPDAAEYLMAENIPAGRSLDTVGMGEGNRLIFRWMERID